jgi:hypothetical protein
MLNIVHLITDSIHLSMPAASTIQCDSRCSNSAPANLVGGCAATEQQHTWAGRTLLFGLLTSLHGQRCTCHSFYTRVWA